MARRGGQDACAFHYGGALGGTQVENREPLRRFFANTEEALRKSSYLLAIGFDSAKLIHRKTRCMDRAHVLGDEISIRVEKLLVIGAVEAIAVDADRI